MPVEKWQKCPLNKLQCASITFLFLKLSNGTTQNPSPRLWVIFYLVQKDEQEREVGCVFWLETGQLLLQEPSFIILSDGLQLPLMHSRLKHIYLKGFLQAKVLKHNFVGIETQQHASGYLTQSFHMVRWTADAVLLSNAFRAGARNNRN